MIIIYQREMFRSIIRRRTFGSAAAESSRACESQLARKTLKCMYICK